MGYARLVTTLAKWTSVRQWLATLGVILLALVGAVALALVLLLPMLAYLHGFGVEVTSRLLFAEVAVELTGSAIPFAMALRARSIGAVIAAEAAVAVIASAIVLAALGAVIGANAAAAIPGWWIALLAGRRACTAVASRLALEREPLMGGLAIIMIVSPVLRMVIALVTGSVTAVVVTSTALHALIAVVVVGAALRRPVDDASPERSGGWGTWLGNVVDDVPVPLAVAWFGGVALTSPLIATSYVSILCWIVFAGVLSNDKMDRGARMILASVLAVGFGLVETTLVPGLYRVLFPSLALHREWFAAIAWAGVLLLAVPLPPSWHLSRSQRSRAMTAVLALVVLMAAGWLGGLAGVALGAAISRALRWRRDEPAGAKR